MTTTSTESLGRGVDFPVSAAPFIIATRTASSQHYKRLGPALFFGVHHCIGANILLRLPFGPVFD